MLFNADERIRGYSLFSLSAEIEGENQVKEEDKAAIVLWIRLLGTALLK